MVTLKAAIICWMSLATKEKKSVYTVLTQTPLALTAIMHCPFVRMWIHSVVVPFTQQRKQLLLHHGRCKNERRP